MHLPEDFICRMETLLGKEADSFFSSFQEDRAYGLRINPLKLAVSDADKILPFTLSPIPWAAEGFYTAFCEHPGRHPLHAGGAYYIQEPSAMAVVNLLNPEPGDIVCDLCAAPGGKSTQIGGRLAGKGLLVANEISPARAKILSQNIERLGIGNSVVCNEPPEDMAAHFPIFFNKILIDAPCSGEGMFRKDETARKEWSATQVSVCAKRQKTILESVDKMLLPGGIMVYSTCTFSREENEEIITWFLESHPDYILEDWRPFFPENCNLTDGFLPKTLRLWPHKLCGEGHFMARLHKSGKQNRISRKMKQLKTQKQRNHLQNYFDFLESFLSLQEKTASYSIARLLNKNACYQFFGDELYLLPKQMNSLQGLKLLRTGLHLGTRKKNRFEPAHALAKALQPLETSQFYECDYDTACRFLKGETISCSSTCHSWTLVSYQGISLGWGKAQNGILKNHYPKGLRITT